MRFERGLGRDGMERVERDEDDHLGKVSSCVTGEQALWRYNSLLVGYPDWLEAMLEGKRPLGGSASWLVNSGPRIEQGDCKSKHEKPRVSRINRS